MELVSIVKGHPQSQSQPCALYDQKAWIIVTYKLLKIIEQQMHKNTKDLS